MLLIAESELSSIMTSESSAALGHHHPHGMLGDHEDPTTFTARSYQGNESPVEFHHSQSPSVHSPSMTAGSVSADAQARHHVNPFSEAILQQQQQQQQQQPISPHHQWDINDTVLPVPKIHDPFCLWPTGHCRRTYRGDSDDARRHVSGWAMRNTNNHNALILKKSCLGVLVCSRDCVMDNGRKVHLRPAICDKARRKQLAKPCPNPSCPGRLELLACRGHCGYPVTHFWRHLNGAVYFQAKGYHDHPRPDVKSLSEKGRSTFSKQIKHEGGRVLSLASKRRFPILTNEAIPDTKRLNQSHDEVMCSCPPFECACPKDQQQHQQQQQQQHCHQFINPPHCHLNDPQVGQHPCASGRAAMLGPDQGYPPAPLTAHPPPPFTQINITNTCLPPTASLDLNIPSVEIFKGCYSSNAQLHVPEQHHYNAYQNYSFQQHKIQFGYPHPHYNQNEYGHQSPPNIDKAHKHYRHSHTESEAKKRRQNNPSVDETRNAEHFSPKLSCAEHKVDRSQYNSDFTEQQAFHSVSINNCEQYRAQYDLNMSSLPANAQVTCDVNKTLVAQNFLAHEGSLVKHERAIATNSVVGDENGQEKRLPSRSQASEGDARGGNQVYSETQCETNTSIGDSSFLYDTISTVFGADHRPPSEQCNPGLTSPAEHLKGNESQRLIKENSQSPPHVYNFLETYTALNQNQGTTPPIYTELTSPQRQNVGYHENFSGPGGDSEHQFYPCSLDENGRPHLQHQQQQQQLQYYPNHHQNQQQLQRRHVQDSPTQNNPIETFSSSLAQQNMARNPNMAADEHYNFYNTSGVDNTPHCHAAPLNHASCSTTTAHPHFNEFSQYSSTGDTSGAHHRNASTPASAGIPCSYPCNDAMLAASAASHQAYRNRSINITLTYN